MPDSNKSRVNAMKDPIKAQSMRERDAARKRASRAAQKRDRATLIAAEVNRQMQQFRESELRNTIMELNQTLATITSRTETSSPQDIEVGTRQVTVPFDSARLSDKRNATPVGTDSSLCADLDEAPGLG